MSFKRFSVSVDDETYKAIEAISQATGESKAEVTRMLIEKGLAMDWVDENTNLVAQIVRQQMEAVIKPHIERLASLSSKSGHMSATSTFLNVQAFMDLVQQDKRKDVRVLYEKARKKAVEYMRTKTSEYDDDTVFKK